MNYEAITTVAFAVCVGIAATVTMDLLASVYRRLGLGVGARGQWVGRWYLGMAHGQFVHSNITTAPERPGEKRAAMLGHYLIGTVLAVAYVVGAHRLGSSPGAFVVAVGFGLATTAFPWFLVFPALGFGVLGRRAPTELRLFSTSLMNHLFYGLGLWWGVNVLGLG